MEKAKLIIEAAQKLVKVAEDLRRLADSIQALCSLISDGLRTDAPDEEPKVSMETVRGVLADRSRAGHTEEIRKILKKYGADRLSAVDPKDYPAIMAEAEELGDE